MQSAAEAADEVDAERIVRAFRLACKQLQSAEHAALRDEVLLVATMANQCDVVLAEFAAGEMESAITVLKDMASMASRLGPSDDPDVNPRWMRCAVKFTIMHRNNCSPACYFPAHYRPLLNDVASHCGGSDVQPGGGRLLTELWADATANRDPKRK